MTIARVTTGKLHCWCDTFRTEYGGIIVLSLYGHRNAVRAVWAATVSGRYAAVGIGAAGSDTDYAQLAQGARYFQVRSSSDQHSQHLVLLHAQATNHASHYAEHIYQFGAQPEVDYFPRFALASRVPLRESWRDAVWELGRQHDLIQPVDGFGHPCYRITLDHERWADVVGDAVRAKELV